MIPVIKPLNQRTADEKSAAQRNDKAAHKTLRALARKEPYCADCTETLTGWVALPHGVFLCLHCAQVHRSLGTHVSRVKAYNTGTYLWYPDEVEAVKQMGNKRACALYRGKIGAPARLDKSDTQTAKFNQAKAIYEKKQWYVELPRAEPAVAANTETLLEDFFGSYGL
jgi:stromal membrane-associated protein